MSEEHFDESSVDGAADLDTEYRFDYAKASHNRFATSCPPGGRLIVLDPDVAPVFTTAEAVNSVLRALIATMPSSRSV